jgi:tetratricopeptide (TPR) repeat protein
MQQGRVQPSRQSHRRDGDARLLACTDRFGLEMCAVGSSTTTAGLDYLSGSIHVNAYLLTIGASFHWLRRANRCLRQPLTGDLPAAIEQLKLANLKGPTWADPLKAWGDALAKQGHAKEGLAKYDEALKNAPNWKELKELREALAKKES